MARVVVIGADGLDWRSFLAQAQAGRTPNLSRLASRGFAGWLAASAFGEGPAAWTSIATGRTLQDHRVFLREEAWAGGIRPVGRASWRAPSIWERLAAAGVSTGSIGWPATRPGGAWPGLHIDDHFAEPAGQSAQAWALPIHCAPNEHRAALRELRVHPADIDGDMLAPFVPGINAIDQSRDVALPHLASALARASTIQAAAAWMVRDHRPDAIFIVLSWLERIRSAFADNASAPFQQVVDTAWRFLDSLIGGLVALAGPQATVLIVSPGRRGAPGVIVGANPAPRSSDAFDGADLLDVAPTVLAQFGLAAEDLPGRALAVLGGRSPLHTAPVPTPDPVVPADPALVSQFEALGYAAPAGAPAGWQAHATGRLALLLAPHAPEVAHVLSAQALAHHRLEPNALMAAALSAILTERGQDLPQIADALEQALPSQRWGDLARGAGLVLARDPVAAAPWLVRAEESQDPNLLLRLAALWLQAARPAKAERIFRRVLAIADQAAAAEIGLSLVALERRDFIAAEAALRRALRADPGRWAAYVQLTRLYTLSARPHEAAAACATAKKLGAPEALANAALSAPSTRTKSDR